MSSHIDGKEAQDPKGVDRNHPLAAHLDIIDRERAIILPPVIKPAEIGESGAILVPAERAPRRKRVALCGFAQTHFHLAPFADPDVEIWGLNQLYRHIPRADRWFEIHANWNEFVVEGTDHIAWLNSIGCPIYMKDVVPEIKNSVRYPIEAMIQHFQLDYFTSTVAYMIELAIAEQFEWIGIFGIDLIMGPEYEFQKACVEYYIGYAHAKGIEVYLPENCALLKQAYRYGWQLEPDWPITVSAVENRRNALVKDKEAAQVKLATLDGALQENGYWLEALRLSMRGAGNILGIKR